MADKAKVLRDLRGRLYAMESQHASLEGAATPEFLAALAAAATGGEQTCADRAGPGATRGRGAKTRSGGGGGGRQGYRRRSSVAAPPLGPRGPWAALPLEQALKIHPRSSRFLDEVLAARAEAEAETEAAAAEAASVKGAGEHEPKDETSTDPPDAAADTTQSSAQGEATESEASPQVEAVAAEGEDGTMRMSEGLDPEVFGDALMGLSLVRHGESNLRETAHQLGMLRSAHDVALVSVVAELEDRQVQPPGGLSCVDWLRAIDPGLSAGAAKGFVTVGRAFNQDRWATLRDRVSMMHITVAKAAAIVDFHERTAKVADPDELDRTLEALIDAARTLRPDQLARLIREETEHLTPPPDADPDELAARRRASRGLWFTAPDGTGMLGMRATLDPEGAAIVKAAIDALSEPRPLTDPDGTVISEDPRGPATRRADALIAMIGRGVAAAEGVPSTEKAKVVVTISLEALLGMLRGAGTTLTGDVLSAGTVRRMACDAGLIPLVLGGPSEVLDVGRLQRLVTPAIRRALTQRDQGCSFPGCSIPPQWCDAHHVTWFSRGGRTSLEDTALLCGRHHDHVHAHDLTATSTATGVTWHL